MKNEVMRLHQDGYSLAEIAEELGISKAKVKSFLEDVKEEKSSPSKVALRRAEDLKNRALTKLKKKFDELVEKAKDLDCEEMPVGDADVLLEMVRSLELDFRSFAREFNFNPDNSEHRATLLTLISELKSQIKDWRESLDEDEEEDDYVFNMEIEDDLLERMDDLRFELVDFEAE